MKNKILALVAMAAVGAIVSVGSADTVMNAFVQQFGATPHTVITTPNNVRNVQIDWRFSEDYNVITACDVTFDKVLPNNTLVICKLSGHDADPTDGVITNGTAGPIVGLGQIIAPGADQRMDVPVLCDPGASLRPQVVNGNFTTPCDVQDIDDVKVIVVGKETCDVTVPGQVPEHCPTTPPPPPPLVPIQNITVVNFGYVDEAPDTTPGDNDTSVVAGTIVNWNFDSIHTVTSGTGSGPTGVPDGVFDSGIMLAGDTYTLNTTGLLGDYHYYCSLHEGMEGTLHVTNGGQDIAVVNFGYVDEAPDATPGDNATSVAAGTLVNWNTETIHTVTSGTGSGATGVPDGTFDSGLIGIVPPETYTLDTTGMAAGDYHYFCSLHDGMEGTLTIT